MMTDLERLQYFHDRMGRPKVYFTKKIGVNVSKEQFTKEAADMTEYLFKLKESQKDVLYDDNGKIILTKKK